MHYYKNNVKVFAVVFTKSCPNKIRILCSVKKHCYHSKLKYTAAN